MPWPDINKWTAVYSRNGKSALILHLDGYPTPQYEGEWQGGWLEVICGDEVAGYGRILNTLLCGSSHTMVEYSHGSDTRPPKFLRRIPKQCITRMTYHLSQTSTSSVLKESCIAQL